MPRKTSLTLSEAVEKYQTMRKLNVGPSTLANDQSCLNAFVRKMGGRTQVHALTPEQVEGYMLTERQRQQASSYNKIVQRLTTFFKFCKARGWMDSDPMVFVTKAKVVRKERFRLSPSDLFHLPDFAANSRDRIFLAIATNTALRANEITRLRVRDVDLASGWLHVLITKSALEDSLPISTELDTELRRWLVTYEKDTGCPLNPDWYLVPRRDPAKGLLHPDRQDVGGIVMQTVGSYLPECEVRTPAPLVQRAMNDPTALHTMFSSILAQVDTWPRALVVVTFILVVGLVRRQKATRNDVKDVKKTLTSNNGGSHVKDALDRIEQTLSEVSGRVETLERNAEKPRRWWQRQG